MQSEIDLREWHSVVVRLQALEESMRLQSEVRVRKGLNSRVTCSVLHTTKMN